MRIKKLLLTFLVLVSIFLPEMALAAGTCAKPAFLGSAKSIYSFVFLSGLASGLNPCVFAVILMIVGYSLVMGKKKIGEVIKVGVAFIATLFALYFAVSFALYSLLEKLVAAPNYLIVYQVIRYGFAAILIFMALVNFKEFILSRSGFGFRIPKGIISRLSVMLDKSSVPMTILLALITGLFALPCSLSICFGMINLLPSDISRLALAGDMLLFAFAFIVPMTAVFALVVLGAEKLIIWKEAQEKYDRWLRLFSGLALAAFAALLFLI